MATRPISLTVILTLCLGALSGTARAADIPPPAYQLAASAQRVPSSVLYSVALVESGVVLQQGRRPWPWTLNVAGTGYRFKDQASACKALQRAIRTVGSDRVDAGLGQLNLGAHGHHFADPCEALNPYKNLAVAASLLQSHYRVTGDWVLAAGRYHRPAGGKPAENYRAVFKKQFARVMSIQVAQVSDKLNIMKK